MQQLLQLTKEQILSNKQPVNRNICGVYFLINEDEIVYVGQSLNVLSRVAVHLTDPTKEFDSFTVIECQPGELGDVEAHYILTWNPVLNAGIPGNNIYKSLLQLKAILQTDINTLKRFIKAKNVQPVSGYYRLSDFAGFKPEDYPSKSELERRVYMARMREITESARRRYEHQANGGVLDSADTQK